MGRAGSGRARSGSRRGLAVRELEGHVRRFLDEVWHTLAHEDLMSLGRHAVRNPDSWLRQRITRLRVENQVLAVRLLAGDPTLTVRQIADRIRYQPAEPEPQELPIDRSAALAHLNAARARLAQEADGR